jgi:hypothetical protein
MGYAGASGFWVPAASFGDLLLPARARIIAARRDPGHLILLQTPLLPQVSLLQQLQPP